MVVVELSLVEIPSIVFVSLRTFVSIDLHSHLRSPPLSLSRHPPLLSTSPSFQPAFPLVSPSHSSIPLVSSSPPTSPYLLLFFSSPFSLFFSACSSVFSFPSYQLPFSLFPSLSLPCFSLPSIPVRPSSYTKIIITFCHALKDIYSIIT